MGLLQLVISNMIKREHTCWKHKICNNEWTLVSIERLVDFVKSLLDLRWVARSPVDVEVLSIGS